MRKLENELFYQGELLKNQGLLLNSDRTAEKYRFVAEINLVDAEK
jgi:hypothetical protein